MHNSVGRRQSLRTRLVLLALGPLLVSSALSFRELQGYLLGRPMPSAEFDVWVEPLVIG